MILFFCGNSTLGELLRLPILVHHYKEHVAQDQDASFWDFLAKHYAERIDHPDDEHRDHEHLPFRSADCATAHICSLVPPAGVSLEPVVFFNAGQKTLSRYRPHYSSAFHNNIWQPPRLG